MCFSVLELCVLAILAFPSEMFAKGRPFLSVSSLEKQYKTFYTLNSYLLDWVYASEAQASWLAPGKIHSYHCPRASTTEFLAFENF